MSDDYSETFKEVEYLLEGMLKDRSVPRNIKRIAQNCINELHNDDDTDAIKASNVIYRVSDLTLDPNIPFHSRTTIYRILSLLEKIKD
jgi:uncharacterized protein (UPF0147 family)